MKFVAKIGSFLLGVVVGIVLVIGGVVGAGYAIVSRPGMVGVISEKVEFFDPDDEIKNMSLLEYGKNIFSVISNLESNNLGNIEDAVGMDLTGMISEAIGISRDELRASALSGEGIINTVMNSESLTIGVLIDKFGITLPDMPLFTGDDFRSQSISTAFEYISAQLDFDTMTVGDLETNFGISLGEMFDSETIKNTTLSGIGETLKILELRELLDITTDTEIDEYVATHVATEEELAVFKSGKTAYSKDTDVEYVYSAVGVCAYYFETEEDRDAYMEAYNADKSDDEKIVDTWEYFKSENNLYLALRPYFTSGGTSYENVDVDVVKTWLVNKELYSATAVEGMNTEQIVGAALSAMPTMVAPVMPEVVGESAYNSTLTTLNAARDNTNVALKYLYNAKIGADSSDPNSINGLMNDIRVSDVTEIGADSPVILQKLASLKVTELGGDKTQDIINETLISDILDLDSAESPVLKYFIDNEVTVGGMDAAISNMTLSDVTVIDDGSHDLIKKLADVKINDIASEVGDIVNESALYEFISIETDATVAYYKARYAESQSDIDAFTAGKTPCTDGATAFDYFSNKEAQSAWIAAEKEKGNVYYDRYEIATKNLVFSTDSEREARYVELWLANNNSTDTVAAESAYADLTPEEKDSFGPVISDDMYAKPYAPSLISDYSVPAVSNKVLTYLYYAKIGSDGADGLNAYMNAMRLNDVMEIGDDANVVLKKVETSKVSELSSAISDAVKTTTIGELIGGNEAEQTKVLQYLWGTTIDGINSKIESMTLKDAIDIPAKGEGGYNAILYKLRDKKVTALGTEINDAVNTTKLGEVITIDDNSNAVLKKLKEEEIGSLSDEINTAVNTTKLGEVISIETDPDKDGYNAILAELSDKEIGSLSTEIDGIVKSTKIGELITINESSPAILQALSGTTIDGLSARIDSLTMADVYGTQPSTGIMTLLTSDEYSETKVTDVPDKLAAKVQTATMKQLKEAGLFTVKEETWTKMGYLTTTDSEGNTITAQDMQIGEFVDFIIDKATSITIPTI